VTVIDTEHTADEARLVQELVECYKSNISLIRGFLMSFHAHFSERIGEDGPLSELVHSVKYRMKDPEHLRSKLFRKIDIAKKMEKQFDINADNLFLKINDLGGYRILHLHTSQAARIHPVLLDVIETAQFDLFEKPFANIWDEEAKTFFEGIGVRAEINPRLYSSVHYVIKARAKRAVTCEIQSRTLADEIWGEVDHRINYPHAHPSRGCREQIKVLARVASSCSRLVDSIMVADDEWTSMRSSEATDETGLDSGVSDAAPPE
jgi:ppGpp synthetase/RelA/SpoT-type nucleotidyltranferase